MRRPWCCKGELWGLKCTFADMASHYMDTYMCMDVSKVYLIFCCCRWVSAHKLNTCFIVIPALHPWLHRWTVNTHKPIQTLNLGVAWTCPLKYTQGQLWMSCLLNLTKSEEYFMMPQCFWWIVPWKSGHTLIWHKAILVDILCYM